MSKSVLKLIRLSSYAPPIGQRNGVFLCYESMIKDLELAEWVCAICVSTQWFFGQML